MPRVDQSTINWAVYEDNTEYAGMAQATLPNLTALTQSISGAGIAGNVDAVILGHDCRAGSEECRAGCLQCR